MKHPMVQLQSIAYSAGFCRVTVWICSFPKPCSPRRLEKGTLDTAIAASKVMIRLMQASGARLCTWEPLLWRNTVKLTRRLVDPTAVMPPAW